MSAKVIGLAWYQRDEWDRLREISSDVDRLEETWDEWRDIAEEKLRELRARGLTVEKVVIEVERLAKWSEEAGRTIDGAARSEYAAELLRKRHMT